jgi:hypothetical protein
MFTTFASVVAFVAGFVVRHFIPVAVAALKAHSATKAVAAAKALVAKAEADAAALEAAKKVVAAQPVPVVSKSA